MKRDVAVAGNRVISRDNGWTKLKLQLNKLGRQAVVVGVAKKEGSKRRGTIDMAGLATVHEFGTAKIPRRSFLRDTFDIHQNKYARLLEGVVKRTTKGADPIAALFKVGEIVRGDVLKRIQGNIAPPLKPATIARKGSALALVDKGILVGSITSKVRKKGLV